MKQNFLDLRKTYPSFTYENYHIQKEADGILLTFDFKIDGLCAFHPTTKIKTDNLKVLNAFDTPLAKKIVFSLGMVELISYWKAACPKHVKVLCGALEQEDVTFFKHLYFRGLSEFFYIHQIDLTEENFMEIEVSGQKETENYAFQNADLHLIPVGGGKDSCVTAELLKRFGDKNFFFTVNDQKARTDTVLAAGYTEQNIVKVYRTIDKNLLALNQQGFLNGHTPFSAIVAFLSYYCAYLIGAKDIVLSNEESANESNIAGTNINHQYSKSYEFESDFKSYTERNFKTGIRYFSLMRAFCELQIAKQFSSFSAYHETFRSCNKGSKQNIWCCKCAKCLFVFSILSPFIPYDRLCALFGSDLFNDKDLLSDFDGLVGLSPVKPFDCVGTISEIHYALSLFLKICAEENRPLPYLAAHFKTAFPKEPSENLLQHFNTKHHIPKEYDAIIKEMYDFVAKS